MNQNHKSAILSPLSLNLTPASSTLKLKQNKTPTKEKRRNSKKIDRDSIASITLSATQWYTATPESETSSLQSTISGISPLSTTSSTKTTTTSPQPPAAPQAITPVFELREEVSSMFYLTLSYKL